MNFKEIIIDFIKANPKLDLSKPDDDRLEDRVFHFLTVLKPEYNQLLSPNNEKSIDLEEKKSDLTAERILRLIDRAISTPLKIEHIKAYGKFVAEQALKDAYENAEIDYQYSNPYDSESLYHIVNKESILSTEIKTP